MNATLPSSPADHLIFILESLHRALSHHADAQRLTGRGSIIGPFLILIWQRVHRIGLRFAARAAREAAVLSPIPGRPQAAPKTVIASEASQSRGRLKPRTPDPLPRHKAWLLRLIPETAPITSQLRYFMAEPEVAALLAVSPRLCSILNPLCHMLGIRAAGIRPAKASPPAILNPPPDAAQTAPPIPIPIPGHALPQAAPITVLPSATPPSPDALPAEFSHALA